MYLVRTVAVTATARRTGKHFGTLRPSSVTVTPMAPQITLRRALHCGLHMLKQCQRVLYRRFGPELHTPIDEFPGQYWATCKGRNLGNIDRPLACKVAAKLAQKTTGYM
jgi:hypothetical protein